MLLKTSQDSLKTAFEYIVKFPFSKRIIHKLSETARGKCIAYFSLHRVLKDSQKDHPHYLNKTAATLREARILLTNLNKFLPFISLSSSLDFLTGVKPLEKSHAVLLIEVPYLETINLLKPLLKELNIPATLVLDTQSLHTGQMPWTDEIIFRLGNTHKPEMCVSFIDRTFPMLSKADRLNAAHHLIENLAHSSPQILLTRMAQLREQVDEVALPPKAERIGNLEQLEELKENHLFSFAFSGHMRMPFYEMNKDEAYQEIIGAQNELSSLFGESFCPVFVSQGLPKRKDKEILRLMMDGLRAAINKNPGVCRPGDNMFQLRSLPLAMNTKSFEQFELQGLSDAIDEFLLITLAQEKEL